MLVTIAATLGVLGVLIVVHELGHFMAARIFDIHVSRFSIGLGPKLLAFQRGETEFRISALPVGGYVKLTGMKEMSAIEGDDEVAGVDPSRTFSAKPAAVRAIVLSAGVAMNVLLAVVIFAGIALARGLPASPEAVVGNVVGEWLSEGTVDLASIAPGTRITRVGGQDVATMSDVTHAIMAAQPGSLTFGFEDADPITITVPERAEERQLLPVAIEPVSAAGPVVGVVKEGSAAARAGLQSGDRVLAIDDQPVATWQALQRTVQQNPGRELILRIQRGEDTFAATLTPATRRIADRAVVGSFGAHVDAAEITAPRKRVGPVAATGYGFSQSWEIVALMGSFVGGLVDGRHSPRELGGPILIGQISGIASRAGFTTLLFFAALLSMNLAVMNLLPIPALDGGHLALLVVEKVRGRPTGERANAVLGRLGFAMVLAITLWGLTADMLRILGL